MLFATFCYISYCLMFLIILIFLKVCYRYSKAMFRLAYYKRQGMFVYPGADRFLVGNLFDSLAYRTASQESKAPIINGTGWLLD